ncbi:MAG: Rpn family recombination-promoting nuclease/putative transposase [Cellulosilyticaceae bacterium]
MMHNNLTLNNPYEENFIMSPKVDFVFKLIFGDEKNKDILIDFLSAILRLPKDKFEGIELINTELLKEFKEDKKGILDVRIKTVEGKQIDIEIQVVPTAFMPERTIFYWSKMYNSQIQPGDTYDELKKCITINIVDFKCVPIDKVHTTFHLTEDEVGYRLTDVLEIHFLELPKLEEVHELKGEEEDLIEWLEFLDAKSRGEMEMLAEKNDNIKKAYTILQKVSQDKTARMAYDARQAEIMDQRTREKTAMEKGIEQGELKKAIEIAEKLLDILDDETIALKTNLSIEAVRKLRLC